mmetsp:Transcript_14252/g.12569  ORF Transcript_14252/g.12569 Transcript_14252/m.12569 type:complete len:139 (+) Transcript_14252:949-1365(+)
MQTDEGIQVTEDQILERVKYCKQERKYVEKEFIKEQDKFDEYKDKQEDIFKQLEQSKANVKLNHSKLDQDDVLLINKKSEIAKKHEVEEEELKFKLAMAKSQQKKMRGSIQQLLDKIDIKQRDRQAVIFKYKKDSERA